MAKTKVENHEVTIRFWNAVAFARETLGDAVTFTYRERLRKLARTNTLAELKAVIVSWATTPVPVPVTPETKVIVQLAAERVEQLTNELKKGANCRVPSSSRQRAFLGYSVTGQEKIASTDFVEDAVGDGWVKVLECGIVDDKAANIAGQTAASTIVAEERKYVPIPETQMNDDGTEVVKVAPWDEVDASKYDDDDDPIWERIARDIRRGKQEELLKALSDADFDFIVKYMLGRRRGRASRKDRDRAASIRDRLRRHYAKAMAGEEAA